MIVLEVRETRILFHHNKGKNFEFDNRSLKEHNCLRQISSESFKGKYSRANVSTTCCRIHEARAVQKCAELLELEKCCKLDDHFQESDTTQPRTSPPRFGSVRKRIYRRCVCLVSSVSYLKPSSWSRCYELIERRHVSSSSNTKRMFSLIPCNADSVT